MAIGSKTKHILAELRGHAPFTILGAVAGIFFMLIFRNLGQQHAQSLFAIFHPSHVVLSAMVTASIFRLHRKAKNFLLVLIVGYIGSIGVATLSDSVIPYIGENILRLHIPTHAEVHEHNGHDENEDNHSKLHIGFIEDWYIVNPAALLGVLIAYFIPRTKFPHAGHVLISTWASSSHILMNTQGDINSGMLAGIFCVLFIAVWLPCCISDIVFPLLFVKSDLELNDVCLCHDRHSHAHVIEKSEDTE